MGELGGDQFSKHKDDGVGEHGDDSNSGDDGFWDDSKSKGELGCKGDMGSTGVYGAVLRSGCLSGTETFARALPRAETSSGTSA